MIALLLAAALPAAAPTCPARPAALPAPYAGWARPGRIVAVGTAAVLPTVDPATVRLAGVPLPTKPGRFALVEVTVEEPGSYAVAIDAKGWIDVFPAQDFSPATALASTTHDHGPPCTGIVKAVRFTLAHGHYRIMVSGLGQAPVKLMLAKGG